jgi:hypothetical protein
MRNIAGQVNNARTQLIGKLGEICVARYYRWCGLETELAAFFTAEEGYLPYNHERDRWDVLVSGWRKVEVKTVHRTVEALPHYVAHLNRDEVNIRRDDVYAFCSFYTRDEGAGPEDVIQYMGYATGDEILRVGTFYRKGECAPEDGNFRQRADNYVVRYDNLHHPHYLAGNGPVPFAPLLADEFRRSRQIVPFNPLEHCGFTEVLACLPSPVSLSAKTLTEVSPPPTRRTIAKHARVRCALPSTSASST